LSRLILPAGIRLAYKDEIPEIDDVSWSRVQSANITTGYVIKETPDYQYPFYAEANVDAPVIWDVFCDLCLGLLGPYAELIMSEIDDEPTSLGTSRTDSLLDILGQHAYQLVNDGFVQFGLISLQKDLASEVFVTTTKYFQVWVKDVAQFRSIMAKHGIFEVDELEFLDEYPRTTTRLPEDKVMFHEHWELIKYFRRKLGK
jgi:hypothetical protein